MINNNYRAFICGIKGKSLSEREKKFLIKYKPWGIILFSRNINTISQTQKLTTSIKKLFKNELNELTKKKQGFDSPFSFWLQNKLFDFAKNILTKDYYNGEKYLNYNYIQNFIKDFKTDGKNPYLLWSLIVLQIYLKKFNL